MAATTPDDVKVKEELERAEACARALAARPKTRQEMGRDLSSLTVCPSEPEAVTHKTKEGAFHPAYIASITATPERFIVGVDVDARDELVSVEPMLHQALAISAQVHAALSSAPQDVASADPADLPSTHSGSDSAPPPPGTLPQAPAKPVHTLTVARADGAYLVSKVLNLEETLGVELRIHIGSLADRVPHPQGFNPADPYAFDKDRFRLVGLPATAYAPARKCLQCPMGALLGHERNYPANKHVPAATSDRAHGVRGARCPYASRCLQKAKQRTVRRYVSDATREAMRDRMLSPQVRAERGVRSKSVEPCFASTKGPQGLRRFHRRGVRGARLEFRLHALAHNLGRLASLARGGRRAGRAGRPRGLIRRGARCRASTESRRTQTVESRRRLPASRTCSTPRGGIEVARFSPHE